MMVLNLIYLIVIALLISVLFYFLLGTKGPWEKFWPFLSIIVLSVLAAGFWVQPAGPNLKGLFWLPPLATGLLMALLLAAAKPTPPPNQNFEEHLKKLPENNMVKAALNSFFWIVIILFFVLVVLGLVAEFSNSTM